MVWRTSDVSTSRACPAARFRRRHGDVVRERGTGRPDAGHVVGRRVARWRGITDLPARGRDGASVLGPDARVLERYVGRVAVRTDAGLARPNTVGLDLQDPMTRGLFDLRDGRYPRGAARSSSARGWPAAASRSARP